MSFLIVLDNCLGLRLIRPGEVLGKITGRTIVNGPKILGGHQQKSMGQIGGIQHAIHSFGVAIKNTESEAILTQKTLSIFSAVILPYETSSIMPFSLSFHMLFIS